MAAWASSETWTIPQCKNTFEMALELESVTEVSTGATLAAPTKPVTRAGVENSELAL